MRIISWNVNGIRAAHKKGLLSWMQEADPDVLLLQETKASADVLPKELLQVPGYECRFFAAKKKGYSGTAIYTRFTPDEWILGIDAEEFDCEGRVISARFGDLVVSSAYFPNSQAEGKRIDYKLAFCDKMKSFMDDHVAQGRHVAVGGDYNTAHTPIDLARPKANENSPGYLPQEREWMGGFLSGGYKDTWRELNPGVTDTYSWWSYRAAARERNVGWRIDYFCVNESYWEQVRSAGILCEVIGSDHCPVSIDVKNPI